MSKPANLTIQFRLPEGAKTSSLAIEPSGRIVFTDEDGKNVVPEYMERVISHHRPNRPDKPKVLARHKQTNALATVGGLQELTRYDSIIVIDTNTNTLKQESVSIACFIRCQVLPEGENFRFVCEEGRLNVYEFYNIGGKPEMVSILKVANDILNSAEKQEELNIAIVTDSELGSHDSINSRKTPVFGPHCLPKGFTLLYARERPLQDTLNRLILICHKQANTHLSYLKQSIVESPEFQVLPEDHSVKYRFATYDDFKLMNSTVSGITIAEGTEITLFRKKI